MDVIASGAGRELVQATVENPVRTDAYEPEYCSFPGVPLETRLDDPLCHLLLPLSSLLIVNGPPDGIAPCSVD